MKKRMAAISSMLMLLVSTPAFADVYRITDDLEGAIRVFLDWELLWIYLKLPFWG